MLSLRNICSYLLKLCALGVGAVFVAAPGSAWCQPQADLVAIVQELVSLNTTAVNRVRELDTAERFDSALSGNKIYLADSERELGRLFGASNPAYVKLGIAFRRAQISQGAAAVSSRELAGLIQRTQKQGSQWIYSILQGLERSPSCLSGTWVFGLSPLIAVPQGRDIVQDYIVKIIDGWLEGAPVATACNSLKNQRPLQIRRLVDLFYLYLYTNPDPFEAQELYLAIAPHVPKGTIRSRLAYAIGAYTDYSFDKLRVE